MAKVVSKKKIKKIKKKILAKKQPLAILPKRIKIRVVGIGGGGGQIVSELSQRITKIKFLAANTDLQALKKIARGVEKFQFGQNLTGGLGTGMDPELGEKIALQDLEKIKKIFKNQGFSILVSCLGGGTGSGTAPIFAKVAKDLKNYSLGIFTLPFLFEGQKRMKIAEDALEKIKPSLNTFVIVPNERVFQIIDQKTQIKEAFSAINKILAENLEGLIEMLYFPGLINIDFADLKTILAGRGKLAFLNTVFCRGENRAEEAAKKILENPLFEYGISGPDRILFNISGSKDLAMAEVEKISKTISNFNKRAKIIFGISQQESLKDSLKITLLAVGCREKPEIISQKKKRPRAKKIIKPISKTRKKIKRARLRQGFGGQERKIPKPKIKKVEPEKPLPTPEIKEEPSFAPASAEATAGKKASEGKEKVEIKTRRNALEIKRELEKAEKEIFAKESQWEVPAFLRRKPKK